MFVPSRVPVFVVYVNYPASMKEYAYLCDFPAKQGDVVLGNSNQRVTVIRTAAEDPLATRYVKPLPDQRLGQLLTRQSEIKKQLQSIERDVADYDWLQSLVKRTGSVEVKRLAREYLRNADEAAALRSS